MNCINSIDSVIFLAICQIISPRTYPKEQSVTFIAKIRSVCERVLVRRTSGTGWLPQD